MIKGIEAVLDFYSRQEIQDWVKSNSYLFGEFVKTHSIDYIRENGIKHPLSLDKINPEDLTIDNSNLRESLSVDNVNSRHRAVMIAIRDYCQEHQISNESLDLYAPESVTPFAAEMRSFFPKFAGSEFLPREQDRETFPDVDHQDICDLSFSDNSFDLIVSNDVCEHIPDVQKMLSEAWPHEPHQPTGRRRLFACMMTTSVAAAHSGNPSQS